MVLDCEVRTPTVGAPGRGTLRDNHFLFPLDLEMVGISDPFPAGTVIWFGSLEFRATDNGYLMELLSPIVNPDAPAPQPRRLRRS